MPLPVIANTTRVSFEWHLDSFPGIKASNVMHFATGAGSEMDLLTEIRANLTDDMFACTANDAVIGSLTAIRLDGTSALVEFVDPSPQTGGAVSTQPMLAVCSTITVRTVLRGRSYRGRIYLPFVAEQEYDAGQLQPGSVADLQTGWYAFGVAMFAADYPMAVASYKLETAQVATDFTARAVASTQRRRQSQIA